MNSRTKLMLMKQALNRLIRDLGNFMITAKDYMTFKGFREVRQGLRGKKNYMRRRCECEEEFSEKNESFKLRLDEWRLDPSRRCPESKEECQSVHLCWMAGFLRKDFSG
ncbi:hypothetical protein Q1695_016328 [Nippostrongylus brasiliensis]|nr:hypothetical protein Q1695_016328 [Nippostrongylus brasiliensis]